MLSFASGVDQEVARRPRPRAGGVDSGHRQQHVLRHPRDQFEPLTSHQTVERRKGQEGQDESVLPVGSARPRLHQPLLD